MPIKKLIQRLKDRRAMAGSNPSPIRKPMGPARVGSAPPPGMQLNPNYAPRAPGDNTRDFRPTDQMFVPQVKRFKKGGEAKSSGGRSGGRGMGAASRGGGAVGGGKKNKMVSEPSKSTGKVLMMSKGGDVNQHKRMAMGMMAAGKAKKKKVRRMRYGGSCD